MIVTMRGRNEDGSLAYEIEFREKDVKILKKHLSKKDIYNLEDIKGKDIIDDYDVNEYFNTLYDSKLSKKRDTSIYKMTNIFESINIYKLTRNNIINKFQRIGILESELKNANELIEQYNIKSNYQDLSKAQKELNENILALLNDYSKIDFNLKTLNRCLNAVLPCNKVKVKSASHMHKDHNAFELIKNIVNSAFGHVYPQYPSRRV